MPISDIMTRKLVTVSPSDTLRTLQPLFKQYGIHHLLVVEENKLLGVISDRDVLRNLSPFVNTAAQDEKDDFLLNRQAHQIMAKRIISITPEAGIRDACEVLLDKRVSLLPVIKDGHLQGVVSWKDILRHFLK